MFHFSGTDYGARKSSGGCQYKMATGDGSIFPQVRKVGPYRQSEKVTTIQAQKQTQIPITATQTMTALMQVLMQIFIRIALMQVLLLVMIAMPASRLIMTPIEFPATNPVKSPVHTQSPYWYLGSMLAYETGNGAAIFV